MTPCSANWNCGWPALTSQAPGQEVPRRVRQGRHYNPGEESLPLHEAEWDRFQKGRRDGCPYGWPECCSERTEGAVTHVVSEATSNGHCFLTHDELVGTVRKVASSRKGTLNPNEQLPMEVAEQAVIKMSSLASDPGPKHLIRQPVKLNGIAMTFYYLSVYYDAETRLARRIGELQSFPHIAPRASRRHWNVSRRTLAKSRTNNSVRRSLQLFGTTCRS